MKLVACPSLAAGGHPSLEPLCAERILMMPSSRVEIGVVPRGTASRRAVLRTYAWSTGPAGDHWPGVELASVRLPEQASGAAAYVPVRGESRSLLEPGGILARTVRRTGGANPAPARCRHPPPGSVRQIVFGTPAAHTHGLGYREVQADQPLTPPDHLELATFDHGADPTICVPLEPGDRPVREVWELVNIAGEDHNFHIHQARFELLRTESLAEGSLTPERLEGARVLHDNVPVPRGGAGCDGTVAAWRSGACVPSRVVVRIPFTITGDFVYHCHILGHEDAGMMAKISVVPARPSSHGAAGTKQ